MIDFRRSRFALLVFLFVIAFTGAGYLFPRRPIAHIGVQVLVSAIMLALMYRLTGRQVFWSETVPGIVYLAAISAVPLGPSGLYLFMAAILLAVVWVVLVKFLNHNWRVFVDAWRSRPSSIVRVVFAALIAGCWRIIVDVWHMRPTLPRHQGPWIRATRVRASDLAGVVEYDSQHFSTMRVEECSDDWMQQLSQVTTDANGHFALPRTSDDSVHCVRVSWPGAKTAHLYVEVSVDAQPLLVRLEPAGPGER